MTANSYPVVIYRAADGADCTNRGVSSRARTAILYRDSPPDGYGGVMLRLETAPKVGTEPYPRAIPHGETRWVMFGGNFAWSTDSRFRQEVSERPIPIHDRVED